MELVQITTESKDRIVGYRVEDAKGKTLAELLKWIVLNKKKNHHGSIKVLDKGHNQLILMEYADGIKYFRPMDQHLLEVTVDEAYCDSGFGRMDYQITLNIAPNNSTPVENSTKNRVKYLYEMNGRVFCKRLEELVYNDWHVISAGKDNAAWWAIVMDLMSEVTAE